MHVRCRICTLTHVNPEQRPEPRLIGLKGTVKASESSGLGTHLSLCLWGGGFDLMGSAGICIHTQRKSRITRDPVEIGSLE